MQAHRRRKIGTQPLPVVYILKNYKVRDVTSKERYHSLHRWIFITFVSTDLREIRMQTQRIALLGELKESARVPSCYVAIVIVRIRG